MNYKKIGNYIKKKRTEKNYSQYTLADELFISREAISKWERGVSLPDISILSKLAQILDVTIESILLGEDIKKNQDTFIKQFLSLIKVNTKLKKYIFTFICLLLILVIGFFCYYFFVNYNSMSVYSFKSDMNNNVYIKDGLFIVTNKKLIFKGGYIEGREKGTNNIRNNLQEVYIYYELNGEKVNIWGYNSEQSFYRDNIINEKKGYDEYFYSDDIELMMNNMYVSIKAFDKEIISKLEFEQLYSNTEINVKKSDHI